MNDAFAIMCPITVVGESDCGQHKKVAINHTDDTTLTVKSIYSEMTCIVFGIILAVEINTERMDFKIYYSV